MTNSNPQPGPPSNSSNLETLLMSLKKSASVFDMNELYPALTDFLQSERQRWASELRKKLPRKEELVLQQTKPTDYQKGLNTYRTEVLTIIKELDNAAEAEGE